MKEEIQTYCVENDKFSGEVTFYPRRASVCVIGKPPEEGNLHWDASLTAEHKIFSNSINSDMLKDVVDCPSQKEAEKLWLEYFEDFFKKSRYR